MENSAAGAYETSLGLITTIDRNTRTDRNPKQQEPLCRREEHNNGIVSYIVALL